MQIPMKQFWQNPCKLAKTMAIEQNNLLSLSLDKVVRFLEGDEWLWQMTSMVMYTRIPRALIHKTKIATGSKSNLC
jgi:hypothetical protein